MKQESVWTHPRSNLQLVSLRSDPTRLRELRHGMDEDVIITAKDYETRLRAQFERVKPAWAKGTWL